MAEEREGWKVVRKRTLKSATMKSMRDEEIIKYKVGKFVYPRKDCGPLCVFSVRPTKSMISSLTAEEVSVYRCTYLPSRCKIVWMRCGLVSFLHWLPAKTVLASAVKLTTREKIA